MYIVYCLLLHAATSYALTLRDRLLASPDIIVDSVVALAGDLGLEVNVDELRRQLQLQLYLWQKLRLTSPFSAVQSPSVSR